MNAPTQNAETKGLELPKLPERAQLIIVVTIALLCGLAASIATFRFLRERERLLASGPAKPTTMPLVVARQDLEPGNEVGQLNVEVIEWPREHEPPKGF